MSTLCDVHSLRANEGVGDTNERHTEAKVKSYNDVNAVSPEKTFAGKMVSTFLERSLYDIIMSNSHK